MPATKPFIIAIDGPSASGKGTLARRLATVFDYAYLDTGLLYRAVARELIRQGGDASNEQQAAAIAAGLDAGSLVNDPSLRTEAVSQLTSQIAALPAVRAALLKFQQDYCAKPPGGKKGAVLDGRDIGTAIAPDAPVKLYVTASAEARAQRRFAELQSRGEAADYAAVLADLQQRDQRDATRAIVPAKPAADAIILDTTTMDAEEAFQEALRIVRERQAMI